MIDGIRRHRANERQFVGDAGGVRQQFGEFHPGLAVLLKLERRFQKFAGLFVEMDFQVLVRIILAVPPREFGFGIEQIHLARSAVLEETNDGLGFGRMVWGTGGEGSRGVEDRGRARRGPIQGEQMGQGQTTQPARRIAEKRAAVDGKIFWPSLHDEWSFTTIPPVSHPQKSVSRWNNHGFHGFHG